MNSETLFLRLRELGVTELRYSVSAFEGRRTRRQFKIPNHYDKICEVQQLVYDFDLHACDAHVNWISSTGFFFFDICKFPDLEAMFAAYQQLSPQ